MSRLGRLLYRSSIHDVFERDKEELFDLDQRGFDSDEISYLKIDSMDEMPEWLELFAKIIPSPMKRRLLLEEASLFILHKDEDLLASAWTQSMAPFSSRYGQEFSDAVMLGPDWTHPNWRGKGMHPYLIRKRVEEMKNKPRLVAVVETGHSSSIAGFEKNGFSLKKRNRVTTIGSVWHRTTTIDLA